MPTFTSSGGQQQYAQEGPYTFQFNEWNSTAAYTVEYSYPPAGFEVTASSINEATNGAPGSYSSYFNGNHFGVLSASSQLPVYVPNMVAGQVTTSVSGSYSGLTGTNYWDFAYDIWLCDTPGFDNANRQELMIWLADSGTIQPSGSPGATYTIGGLNWVLWSSGAGNTASFVCTSNQTAVTNLDLLPFIQRLITNGIMPANWYLIDVEMGFEIWQGGVGLTMNSFSVSGSGGGGGGGSTDNVTVDFTTNITAIDPLAVGFVCTEFGGNPVPLVGNTGWKASCAALAPGHVRCSVAYYSGNPGYGAGGSSRTPGSATALITAIKSIGAIPLVSYNGDSSDNGGLTTGNAAGLVDYFNNGGGQNGGPVHYWSVGNEPEVSGPTPSYSTLIPAMVAASAGINVGAPAAAYWDTSLISSVVGISGLGALSYHAYDGGNTDGTGFPTDPQLYTHINQNLPAYQAGLLYGVEEMNWSPSYTGQTQFMDWHNTCFIADNCGQALSGGGHATVYGDSNGHLGILDDGSVTGTFGVTLPAYWGLGIWTGMNGQFKRWGAHMVNTTTTFTQGSLTVFASDSGKIVIVNKTLAAQMLAIGITQAAGITTGTYKVWATQQGNPTGPILNVASGSFTGSTINYTIPGGTAVSIDVTPSGGAGPVSLLANNFEEGTNSTTLTTTNTAGTQENAFDVVTIDSTASAIFSSTEANGKLSGRFATGATAGRASVSWTTSLGGTQSTIFGRTSVYLTASPTTTDSIWQHKLSGAAACSIQINTSRKLVILDANGATVHTFTSTIPTGQFVGVEWGITFSSTIGRITVSYYANANPDSYTDAYNDTYAAPVTETYTSPASENFNGGCNEVDFGWTNVHASQPNMYLDDIALSTTGIIGPVQDLMAYGSAALPPLQVAGDGSIFSTNVSAFGSAALPPLAVAGVGFIPAPTWPTNVVLPLKVELLLNGAWTDITDYVYQRDNIVITRGRANETQTVTGNPSQATLTLNNRLGVFSPGNVNSVFYPYISTNVQLRISIVGAATAGNASNYTGYRFWGEVSEWPPQWDTSGNDVYVAITAAGVLRRYVKGAKIGSPMRRYYTKLTGNFAPLAYWPAEDSSGASQISSAVAAVAAMTVTGSPNYAGNSAFAGSDPIPTVGSSTWHGITLAATAPTGSGALTETTPGTYTFTAPPGVTTVNVGPNIGSGGGGAATGATEGGGAGGGGESALDDAVAVTPGKTYTYVVPPGGIAGITSTNTASNTSGSDGTAATFAGDSVTVTANGGKGGNVNAVGGRGGTGSTNKQHFNGGVGGTGQFNAASNFVHVAQGINGIPYDGIGAQQTSTAVTWTAPVGIQGGQTLVFAGGSGGGGAGAGPTTGAGAGGSGAWASGNVNVTAGTSYTIKAGNGGWGGNVAVQGNTGGPSIFAGDGTSAVEATGGEGGHPDGTGGTGGTVNAGSGKAGAKGGNGAASTVNYGGGGGGGAGGAGQDSVGAPGENANERAKGDGVFGGGDGGWGLIDTGSGAGTGQSNPVTGNPGYAPVASGGTGGGGGGGGPSYGLTAKALFALAEPGKQGAGGGAGWVRWSYTVLTTSAGGGGASGGTAAAGSAGLNSGVGGPAVAGGGAGGTVGAEPPSTPGGGGAGGLIALPAISEDASAPQNGAPGQVSFSWDSGGVSPVAGNIIRFVLDIDAAGETNGVELVRIITYGTVKSLRLTYQTGGFLTLAGYNAAGGAIFTSASTAFEANGRPILVDIELLPDGGPIVWSLSAIDPNGGAPINTVTGDILGLNTIGNVSDVYVNFNGSTFASDTAIGEIAVQQYADTLTNVSPVVAGYNGEFVTARLTRLCAEQGVGLEIIGNVGFDEASSGYTPLAWWKLNDPPGTVGGGSVTDSASGLYAGTPQDVDWGDGNEAITGNTSAAFNGTTARVDTALNPVGLGAFTVGIWVNVNYQTQTGNPRLIANSHTDEDHAGFELLLNAGTTPTVAFGNGTITSWIYAPTAILNNGWNQLVGTYDSSTGLTILYVNGVQVATGSLTGNMAAGTANVGIGYDSAYSGDYFSGLLSEAILYPVAIPADQIANLYNQGLVTSDTPQMGPQPNDTFVNLLQYCEDLDLGLLFETRDRLGLGYRTRVNLQGQDPALTLDYSQAQVSAPFTPTQDDQTIRNDITLTRNNGGSVTTQALTGARSILDPPNGVGDYTYSNTVYGYADSQLTAQAAWLLAIGTNPEYRYPDIVVDLSRALTASLMMAAGTMDIGDFLQVANPPGFLTQSIINQLAFGFTENLNNYIWTIDANAVPETPYGEGNPPTW